MQFFKKNRLDSICIFKWYAYEKGGDLIRIDTDAEIAGVFNLLHDGIISGHVVDSGILKLEIKIQYLASRIQQYFTKFYVEIVGAKDVYFKTWEDEDNNSTCIRNIETIFKPKLDILSGKAENKNIVVICNQPSPDFAYVGGQLYFNAKSLIVSDESERYYEFKELDTLCDSYWTEWKKKQPVRR